MKPTLLYGGTQNNWIDHPHSLNIFHRINLDGIAVQAKCIQLD
jgi:hypothetical protein